MLLSLFAFFVFLSFVRGLFTEGDKFALRIWVFMGQLFTIGLLKTKGPRPYLFRFFQFVLQQICCSLVAYPLLAFSLLWYFGPYQGQNYSSSGPTYYPIPRFYAVSCLLTFLSQPQHKFELLFPFTLDFRAWHIGLLHFQLSCWAFRSYFAGLLLSSDEYVKKRVSTKIKPDH